MDLLGCGPFANDDFGFDADAFAHGLRHLGKGGFRLFAGFSAHDFLDPQPLLEVAVGDDIEQDETAIGILGAHACIMHGAAAFRGIVDHRHEFAAVTFKS
ncbi:hypothetical protein D9M72_599710 [compost metagenome]